MWDDDGYYAHVLPEPVHFFMLTLVLAKNYLVMFIGWEGVGLASYLLSASGSPKTRRQRPARKHLSLTASETSDS